MKLNFTLSHKIALLCLGPSFLISLVFSLFFIDARVDDVEEALKRQGSNILLHLSPEAHLDIVHQKFNTLHQSLQELKTKYPLIQKLSIVSPEGQILSGDPSPFTILQLKQTFNLPDENLVTSAKMQTEASETVILEDANEFYFLMKLDDIEGPHHLGFMILSIPKSVAYLLEKQAILTSVALMILMLGFYIFLTFILHRYLSKPIHLMRESAKKIQEGNYEASISFKSFKEFELLKNTWNQMEQHIRAFTQTLKQEVKVATAQLEAQNQELEQARLKAQESEKTKAEFLANMSHEIRTPLSAILGFTELLLSEKLPKVQKDYLDIIQKSASDLLQILNDILDFSKIEAGRLVLHLETFELRAFLEEIFQLFASQAEQKKIKLILEWENKSLWIASDRLRLKQILMNLIGNALKFTERGEVRIQVSLTPNHRLKIAVIDTGMGLSKADQSKLFQAFSQADTSATRQHGGTGLGLIISKKLTQLLGGEIDLESQENQGSTFWITLPFETVSPSTDQTLRMDSTVDIQKCSGLSVLVVDDHAITLKLALKILEKFGVSASGVSSGKAALTWLEKNPVDLIFMDLQMPEMDGFTTAKSIQTLQLPSPPKIFALSADINEAQSKNIKSAGMAGYFLKPLSDKDLKPLLSEVLIEKVRTSTGENWDEITRLQIKALPEIYEQIQTALVEKNLEQLIFIIHKLHGGLCYTSLHALKENTKLAEQTLKQSGLSDLEPVAMLGKKIQAFDLRRRPLCR